MNIAKGIAEKVKNQTEKVVHKVQNKRPPGSSTGEPAAEGTRQYLIGGNWKCNGTTESLKDLIKVFNDAGAIPANVEVAICAPDLYINLLNGLREDIAMGAQNCGVNEKCGAFTGETCATQLIDVGVTWVIIGHSERREGFGGMDGEDEELCAKKLKVALDAGLKVMFAIGEKKEEREGGITMEVCAKQLAPAAKLLSEDDWKNVAIAYEPVWAIGTGLTATPEMAQETHKSIREWVAENVSADVAAAVRIQYGGSMKGANAKDLLAQPDIDGGLIGGASLKADFFNVVNGAP